jgi:hypothetical protein
MCVNAHVCACVHVCMCACVCQLNCCGQDVEWSCHSLCIPFALLI